MSDQDTKAATDVSQIETLRDFEKALRGLGFSQSRAKSLAMHGWRDSDTPEVRTITISEAEKILASLRERRENDQ